MPDVKRSQNKQNQKKKKKNQNNKRKQGNRKSFRHYDDPTDQAQNDNDFDQLLDAYMAVSE